MQLLRLPELFLGRQAMQVGGDFAAYATGGEFTSVLTDSGTAAVGDASGGGLVLSPSDGTVADNDEAYVRTTNELFLFANDKPMVAECILQYAEAATNAANVAFGFMNAVAANSILDNGGGPAASFSGAVIYKVDGGTVWRCRSSIGTTNTDTITTVTAGGASAIRLRIEVAVVNSYAEVTYHIGGVNSIASTAGSQPAVPLGDSTSVPAGRPIKHRFAITSATEMHLFAGVKNGTAAQQALTLKRLVGAIAF